ncbi:MAG: SH3 domain-containing protein [Hyphomonas sp.]
MTTTSFRLFLAAAAMAVFMTAIPAASAQPQPQPEGPRYVKSESVNVRGGPGTGNTVIEVLILGTEVQIYATNGNWSRISPPDKPEKWIYSPLLQKDKPPAKAKAGDKHPDQKAKSDKDRKDEPSGKQQQPVAEKAPQPGKTDAPDNHDGQPNQQAKPGQPH